MAKLVDPLELQRVLGLAGSAIYDAADYAQVAAAASDALDPLLDQTTLTLDGQGDVTTPAVREAALAIAVDLWNARVSPGGQLQAVDFTPGPYRLGRSLLSRVSGLVAPYLDTAGMVG